MTELAGAAMCMFNIIRIGVATYVRDWVKVIGLQVAAFNTFPSFILQSYKGLVLNQSSVNFGFQDREGAPRYTLIHPCGLTAVAQIQ